MAVGGAAYLVAKAIQELSARGLWGPRHGGDLRVRCERHAGDCGRGCKGHQCAPDRPCGVGEEDRGDSGPAVVSGCLKAEGAIAMNDCALSLLLPHQPGFPY